MKSLNSNVLLVCSTATHVRMFLPVAQRVRESNGSPLWLSLDAYTAGGPGGGVRAAWQQEGQPGPLVELGLPYQRRAFYDLPRIWRGIMAVLWIEPALRRLLQRTSPVACLLGNDQGLPERLLIAAARRIYCKTIVIQDGFLPVNCRRDYYAYAPWPSRVVRACLTALAKSYLLSGPFGSAGADVVGVLSPFWRDLLVGQGVPASRVVVVGSTLYESILGRARSSDVSVEESRAMLGLPKDKRVFTFFTCNFRRGLHDNISHQTQLREITALYQILHKLGWFLLVKLHPADEPSDYAVLTSLGPDIKVIEDDLLLVLQATDAAATTISAAAVEAYLVGRPCLLARGSFAGTVQGDFMEWLALPSYSSQNELRRLLESWEKVRDTLVEQGRKRVAELVLLDNQSSATDRIFQLIPPFTTTYEGKQRGSK